MASSATTGGAAMIAKNMSLKQFLDGLRKPTIVGLCGSQRIGSFNKMLHDISMKKIEEKGAIIKPIDLGLLNLPLYNPNDEQIEFPIAAKTLKEELINADGIFITCPEYNGLMSPLMLNAITWATRGDGGPYDAIKNKLISIMATSPGPMGGLRMLRSMHQYIQDMGGIIVPGQNAIGGAHTVFSSENEEIVVSDPKTMSKIDTACEQLVHFARFEASRERDCAIFKELMQSSNMGEYGQTN